MIKFKDATELGDALLRAEKAHVMYEKQIGHRDENWDRWYAAFIYHEQNPD